MARRKRTDIPDSVMRPLAVGVFLIMIVAVVVLQFFVRSGTWDTSAREDSFQTLLDDYLPKDETVLAALQPTLGQERLLSQEYTFAGRNSLQTRAYVSKPEGGGGFPVVVLVHDAPASQRSTQRLSATVGEEIAERHGAIVVAIDWQEESTSQNDLSDVVSAVDWIDQLQASSDQPIIVAGIGYGGYLSFLAADELSVDGVVSIGGYVDPADVYSDIQGEQKKDATISERAQQFLTSLGCENSADPEACLEQLSARDALRTDIPALLIHNKNDTVIPVSQTDNIAELLGESVEVYRLDIDSDQHDTLASPSVAGYAETIDALNEWLSQQLNDTVGNTTVEIIVPEPEEEPTDQKDAVRPAERQPIKIEVDAERLLENAADQTDS